MNSPGKLIGSLALLLLAYTASDIYIHYLVYNRDWFGITLAMPPLAQASNNTSKAPKALDVSLFKQVDRLMTKLPSGTKLKAADFETVLGHTVATNLHKANVSRVEVSGDLFTLTQSSATTYNENVEMRVAQQITFNYQHDTATGLIHFTNIKGVEVRGSWLLGWMPLEVLEIRLNSAGDTALKITIDTIFGETDHTLVVETA